VNDEAIRALWLIAGQIAAMDYRRLPLPPADVVLFDEAGDALSEAGDALVERLCDFWVVATGQPPGVSQPTSGEDIVSEPFVRFVQQMASEILSDLERQAPLGRTDRSTEKLTPLRASLQQFTERPEKVSERLKVVRGFWQLPSSAQDEAVNATIAKIYGELPEWLPELERWSLLQARW
jgi:hypothetical protein